MLSKEQMRKNWGYIVTQGNFGREQGTPLPLGDRLFSQLSFKPHVMFNVFSLGNDAVIVRELDWLKSDMPVGTHTAVIISGESVQLGHENIGLTLYVQSQRCQAQLCQPKLQL